jgi:hypothetical protein
MRCTLILRKQGGGQLEAEHLIFNVVSLSPYLHLEQGAALAQKLRWIEDEILFFN